MRQRADPGVPSGYSYYMRATKMNPEHYQLLIDRCWRRSGDVLYRPNQRRHCCPHYTLRLDSNKFRPTKDQRQTINRFNKYVIGEPYAKEAARLYPKSREQARRRDMEFDLKERIHECESSVLKQPPQPSHPFSVTLESIDFTEEKYQVYANYQRVVHHEDGDDISRDSFKRFLCTSPLKQKTKTMPDGSVQELGSFHQCYRLDGKLVAIGVIDLLPHSVSAVYFLYHESIHRWSPGKLGALREIALASEGGYDWWYPGYYIHTCPKMKYKIDYSPQYILDPSTLDWTVVDEQLLAKFTPSGYLALSDTEHGSQPGSGSEGAASRSDSDSDGDAGSLFESNMPGILPLHQVETLDLGEIAVCLGKTFYFAGDVFAFDEAKISDSLDGPKGAIAELVAAIGEDFERHFCLDLRPSR